MTSNRRRPYEPLTFPNTSASIRVVDWEDLIPGKEYLIQYKDEGTLGFKLLFPDYSDRIITRFKGTFVRYDDTLRGDGYLKASDFSELSPPFAVFENVKIIGGPKKVRFNFESIYVIQSDDKGNRKVVGVDQATDGIKEVDFLKLIKDNNKVAFSTLLWYFGEASQTEQIQKRIFDKIGKGSELGRQTMTIPGPGVHIKEYLGHKNLLTGNEVQEVGGKRKKATRMHKKSNKSRNSRKIRTIKRRRNY